VARIAAIVPDLFFASKVTETLTSAGHEVSVVQPGEAVDADLLIVDLDATGDRPALPTGTPRLGFYSHVDVDTRKRAEEQGFDLVVPRSRMARQMPELVEKLTSGGPPRDPG
jgi:hypothetical protein